MLDQEGLEQDEPESYTVVHCFERLKGGYAIGPTETKQGEGGQMTLAVPMNKCGFTALDFEQVPIAPGGQTAVRIFYARHSYTLTIDYVDQDGKTVAPQHTVTLKFEESYDVPSPVVTGYTPDKQKVSDKMPDGNVKETVTYQKDANTHTLKYMNGTSQYGDEEKYIAGAEVRVRDCTLQVEGSRFAGWSTTSSTTVVYKAGDTFEIQGNTVLYAVWNLIQENNADYTVKHYKEKLDGTYPDTPDETETIPGKVGEQTAAAAKDYTGFTTGPVQQKQITKQGVTVWIYYARNEHTLTIDYVDQDGKTLAPQQTETLRYEATYDVPSPAVAGYTPDKQKVSGTMQDQDVKVTVTYTPVQNYGYTIHHVELGSNKQLAEDTVGMALLGTTIDVAAQKKNIAGFAYDSCDIAEIVMGEDENEATIYYARQSYGYTIHHVELGSNKQLAEDTTGTALYGAKVVTSSAKKEMAGYAYHSDTGDIVIGTDAAANVATIYYMVPEIGMGSLKIKKTVTGEKGDKTKLFTFTVTFDRAVTYGDQPADTFTFQLKHGESITLPNIPEGTKYEVKESDHEGYRVSSSGAKGTIVAGKTSVASFVNSKGVPLTGDSGSKVLGAVIMGASILAIIGLVYADRKLGKRKNAR